MKKYLLLLALLAVFTGTSFQKAEISEEKIVLNMANEPKTLPSRFRTCQDPFITNVANMPSREGLDALNASGSSQFSLNALELIIERLNNPPFLLIVDLREESHGFVNGNAVSWYEDKNWGNKGLSLSQIRKKEKNQLGGLKKSTTVHKVITKDPNVKPLVTEEVKLKPNNVQTEQDVVTSHAVYYVRIPVSDHIRPSDKQVDRFLLLCKQIPKDCQIHLHCKAGKGRTTTFLTMYDMIKNAKTVSKQDIITRQFLIGGADLTDLSSTSFKAPYTKERLQFLNHFYEYCKNNTDNFKESWSEYCGRTQFVTAES